MYVGPLCQEYKKTEKPLDEEDYIESIGCSSSPLTKYGYTLGSRAKVSDFLVNTSLEEDVYEEIRNYIPEFEQRQKMALIYTEPIETA